jgi:hypothetical protein
MFVSSRRQSGQAEKIRSWLVVRPTTNDGVRGVNREVALARLRLASFSQPPHLLLLLQTDQGFNPNRSRVSFNTMEEWKNKEVDGNLLKVPGIGPAAVARLAEKGVANSWQLCGTYLTLKGPDEKAVDPATHNDKFWYWLQQAGIRAHRSAIVVAIAEKMAQTFPGIYDATDYDEEEEEE